MLTAAASAAPVKRAGKVDQAPTKPVSVGQSSVFVFKGMQTAPAQNGPTTAAAAGRPAGMSLACLQLDV